MVMVSPASVVIAALGWLFGLCRLSNHMYLRLKAVYSILGRQPFCTISTWSTTQVLKRGAPWPSGRASDIGARGRGFDPHSRRRVVSLSKIHLPPQKYW